MPFQHRASLKAILAVASLWQPSVAVAFAGLHGAVPLPLPKLTDSLPLLASKDPVSDPFATCAPLANRGTHFTVEIGVGTPSQKFDVVADTGSDAVIVGSCMCKETHHCNKDDKCFRGINRSSTFSIGTTGAASLTAATEVPVVILTFGSGQIEAMIASDVVQVGKASANMDDGLLLMIDQALRMDGPFEGILGLGLPKKETKMQLLQKPARPPEADGAAESVAEEETFSPKGFLQSAGVHHFSMCFNNGASGVLRLGGPKPELQLGSVGQAHWGLTFNGMSVGGKDESTAAPLKMCSKDNMKPGQETPCGAIPDSGTTVMMGPAEHLKVLFTGLCDNWELCKKEAKKILEPKYLTFQALLMDCADWLDEKEGLNVLPPIYFHLEGASGQKQTLKIPGPGYVMEMMEDEVKYVRKSLMGMVPVEVAEPTGKQRKVCAPAFGQMDYNTVKNGPVWILGTPLFYEYQVGYDLQANPPAVSFSEEPCGECKDFEAVSDGTTKTSFLLRGRAVTSGRRSAQKSRGLISGPFRNSSIDTSSPL